VLNADRRKEPESRTLRDPWKLASGRSIKPWNMASNNFQAVLNGFRYALRLSGQERLLTPPTRLSRL
jgi:hypothetical protein